MKTVARLRSFSVPFRILIAGAALTCLGTASPPSLASAHNHGHAQGAAPASSPSGTLEVAREQQQILGFRVTPVEKTAGARVVRAVGRVTPDEARVYRLNAGIEGSIRDLSPVTTGGRVKKNQVLGSFYAPGAISVIQLYILNLGGRERLVQRHTEGSVEGEGLSLAYTNIQQRTMQLENIGMSALQREELSRTRTLPDTIKIVAPADGIVLSRNVTPGQKFERGFELYRIADLRRVWIVADLFAQDARQVHPGLRARILAPQSEALEATVAEILPQFDPSARTLKVRLEVDNRGYALRPDMVVDVRFEVARTPALVVPADAVVDSGLRKTVFVQCGEGLFQPRDVETGWRDAGLVEIVQGLSPGERIVTSGTFFLDSESRTKAPASGAAASCSAVSDPTGHDHASSGGAGEGHGEHHDPGEHHGPGGEHGGSQEAAHAHAGHSR
jgi:membrane fusion protein, copper/silver efflux system